jgi:hypothetical protein
MVVGKFLVYVDMQVGLEGQFIGRREFCLLENLRR